MSSLKEFRASINKTKLNSPTRYRVDITPPRLMNTQSLENDALNTTSLDVTPEMGKQISMYCSEFVFPSQNLATVESRYIGNTRKVPYLKTYDDLSAIFYCSEDLQEYRYFLKWQELCISKNHDVNFYDDYIGSIEVTQLDKALKDVYTFPTINEVYPLTVNAIPIAYVRNNEFSRCVVNFSWR